MKSVTGLILAAGKSERMGKPKALLRIFDRTFLEHIVAAVEQSRLQDVKIVLGHQSEDILRVLPSLRERTLINAKYESGQLSSIQCGIRSVSQISDGVMVFLIDNPVVYPDLINSLLSSFDESSAPLVIPSFQNRRGHPMIFGRELFEELLGGSWKEGAATVVQNHQADIRYLTVDNADVLIDIDTPDDYEENVVRAGRLL